MPYNGPLRRSCPRSRVRPGNRHKREPILIHRRCRCGRCTSTPCKSFFSTVRRDARHWKLHGQGRKFFIPQQTPYIPQEAVTFAALVGEQLKYQVLPSTEIPVPKSLIIPVGMNILTHQTADSVDLMSPRQKLQTSNFCDRPGGAQLWAGT